MSSVGPILEKLNFDRMLKPQIDLMWKVIDRNYVSSPEYNVRRQFEFEPILYYIENSDITDLHHIMGTYVKPVYDFRKAKKIFIKEPFVCFCIDSDVARFDFNDTEKIRKEFFDDLVGRITCLRLRYVKTEYPVCFDFLTKDLGYNEDNENITVNLSDIDRIRNHKSGEYLFNDYYNRIKSDVDSRRVEHHRMKWIDGNLHPIFIWDTDGGFVYTCHIYYRDLVLDRRVFNRRGVTKITQEQFARGVLISDLPEWLGLPRGLPGNYVTYV